MSYPTVSNISFARKNGKFVCTHLDGRIPKFMLGTNDEPLRAPFGISDPYSGEDSDRLTFDLEVQDESLLSFLHSLDEQIVATAVTRSVEWFGKELNEAAIRAMHTPLVQAPKKDTYLPTVRTKFSLRPGKSTAVYVFKSPGVAANGSKADITKDCHARPYVSMSSVMFGNRQFGVSLTCESVMIWKAADATQGLSMYGDFMLVDE
jgi:hypothetical protein